MTYILTGSHELLQKMKDELARKGYRVSNVPITWAIRVCANSKTVSSRVTSNYSPDITLTSENYPEILKKVLEG